MAGWDAYRDNLIKGGNCSEAAIIGLSDGSVWTVSKGLADMDQAQTRAIISGFANSSGLQSGGIRLGGVKYMFLQSDESQIQGKKGSTAGVSIAKCNQCVVIGVYGDGQQAGNCRKSVESIADYLKQSSY